MLRHETPETGSEGHGCNADEGQGEIALASRPPLPEGQPRPGKYAHVMNADGQPNGGEEGQARLAREGQTSSADLAATIVAIRSHHRVRNHAMDQRKRVDLSLGAFLRLTLGWRKDAPAADRKRINAHAETLAAIGEDEAAMIELEARADTLTKREQTKLAKLRASMAGHTDPAYTGLVRHVILADLAGRASFDAVEDDATKAMERHAVTLPVWAWGEGVRGFGARSLAVIVGEAGDLSAYPKKGHLWKRMGLAPLEGKAYSTWRLTGGLSAKDWTDAGYSPRRRAAMYVIGDRLVQGGDHYRQVYLTRKAAERAKAEALGLTVAPSAKIPKARAKEFISDGHIHRRAQRYMEKMLLRDLWMAWRLANQAKECQS